MSTFPISKKIIAVLTLLLSTVILNVSLCQVRAENSSTSAISPSERIINRADWVFNNAESVHYQHHKVPAMEQVRSFSNGRCEAKTDCSGFVSFLLSDFPKQYDAIRKIQPERTYPQAKVFTDFFVTLPSGSPKDGWLKVENIRDLRRGDFVAWKKPPATDGAKKKGNTGHIAVVLDVGRSPEFFSIGERKLKYLAVNVIDSSSVKHFQPEILPPLTMMPHRDGIGKGTVRIILDEQNRPIGYWEGTYWYEGSKDILKPTFTESISFARVVNTEN